MTPTGAPADSATRGFNMKKIPIKRLPSGEGLPLPTYSSHFGAGMDLRAALDNTIVIKRGEKKLLPTGFAIALPPGYEAQVRPWSHLVLQNKVSVLNTAGPFGEDYRGEISVMLVNLGEKDFKVKRGDRIAQLVINKSFQIQVEETDELPPPT